MAVRASSACVLLVAAVAALAAFSAPAEARNLLGPAPYIQCGGRGGECKGAQCKDAAWTPAVTCAGNFVCTRVNQWYWQCDAPKGGSSKPNSPKPTAEPSSPTPTVEATTKPVEPVKPTVKKPTVKAPTPTKPTKRPNYTPTDFKQCGGSGNNCQGSKCKDAVWPGATCKEGLTCFRISKYYWGCDVKQPATEAPAPISTPAPGAFKQCGGLNGGGCEKNKTCADAQWKGKTCPAGFKCYRANKYHWQCDLKPITNGGK